MAATPLACAKKDDDSGKKGGGTVSGCIQGVLVNGLTSERVAMPTGTDKGLFVLVRDDLLDASSVTGEAPTGAEAQLAGEYYLCGIPLDEGYPVFVWLDGFLPFESEVKVHSTAASRSPNANADLLKPEPTEVANIRVYPKNQLTKDLEVLILHNGAPLVGATVLLRSVGTNFLDPAGLAFLPPRNVRSPTLKGTSGADGKLVFPAAELVLGGHYTYTVIPPDSGKQQTAIAADTFILGLRSDADETEPFRLNINLDHAIGELSVLTRSTDREDPEPTGKLVVFLNREFEVIPGTEDGVTASLSGNVTAQLADENATNKAPDLVKVTIDANKLTLEPVWKTNPDADQTKEPTLAITYSGLQLRPKTSPGTLSTVTINQPVRFYR